MTPHCGALPASKRTRLIAIFISLVAVHFAQCVTADAPVRYATDDLIGLVCSQSEGAQNCRNDRGHVLRRQLLLASRSHRLQDDTNDDVESDFRRDRRQTSLLN